ncbi:hypothetical protein [Paucimonas lemoignei]|uniref:hypothetical protein n=1 Tax=Paucimonas lemoignei TaxID=29443 RepID=UPI0014047654|nr:hypothetical protein [Paucimonas lemoignei]
MSSIDDKEIYNDKAGRYKSMSFLVNSYLDYMVLHISVLPIDKNELQYSVAAPGVNPELSMNRWGGSASGYDFTWDKTWKTPKQFKVWWQRIVDPDEYAKNKIDARYLIKETERGTAWCEAIITINNPLPEEPGYFILHFYPDGHVDAYISELKELEAEQPKVKFEDRMKLSVLREKPCLKEIPNPYYGLPKPVQQN